MEIVYDLDRRIENLEKQLKELKDLKASRSVEGRSNLLKELTEIVDEYNDRIKTVIDNKSIKLIIDEFPWNDLTCTYNVKLITDECLEINSQTFSSNDDHLKDRLRNSLDNLLKIAPAISLITEHIDREVKGYYAQTFVKLGIPYIKTNAACVDKIHVCIDYKDHDVYEVRAYADVIADGADLIFESGDVQIELKNAEDSLVVSKTKIAPTDELFETVERVVSSVSKLIDEIKID